MDLSFNKTDNSSTRYLSLDFIRGIAIFLMIVFHLCFNLHHFQFIDINIYHSSFWHYFRYSIVTIFLLCVGISLYISNTNGINYSKTLKRFLTLSIASIVISVATYFIFPNSWIYFGVLHFITLSSILGLPFVSKPIISLIVGFLIILGWNLGLLHMHWLFDISKEMLNLPSTTEDLVPLTPWFGVVLIGIFIGKTKAYVFHLKISFVIKGISKLGENSLIIYLAHQPILFGFIFLIYKLN